MLNETTSFRLPFATAEMLYGLSFDDLYRHPRGAKEIVESPVAGSVFPRVGTGDRKEIKHPAKPSWDILRLLPQVPALMRKSRNYEM
jgi:hypothetical protein